MKTGRGGFLSLPAFLGACQDEKTKIPMGCEGAPGGDLLSVKDGESNEETVKSRNYSLVKYMLMPWPPPMHMLIMASFLSERCSS